jgi:hypothetical protein
MPSFTFLSRTRREALFLARLRRAEARETGPRHVVRGEDPDDITQVLASNARRGADNHRACQAVVPRQRRGRGKGG